MVRNAAFRCAIAAGALGIVAGRQNLWLPDWNCAFSEQWTSLREGFEFACAGTRSVRSLECAATITNWREHGVRYLSWTDKLESNCPLGEMTLQVLAMLMMIADEELLGLSVVMDGFLSNVVKIPYAVHIGSDWPIFALLNSASWDSWPRLGRDEVSESWLPEDYFYDEKHDCLGADTNTSVLDWAEYLDVVTTGGNRADLTIVEAAMRLGNAKHVVKVEAQEHCLYGLQVIGLMSTLWIADTDSSSYQNYTSWYSDIWQVGPHFLGASRWPFFAILHHGTLLRRHGFYTDFTDVQLSLPMGDIGRHLQSRSLHSHIQMTKDIVSPPQAWVPPPGSSADLHVFENSISAILAGLALSPVPYRFVYVTMVYGSMNQYIQGWAERVRHLGITNLLMFALDEEAFAKCQEHHNADLCVRGSVSVFNKFMLPLVALQLGVDAVWLDFDMYLFQDPTPHVMYAAEGYDMLMAYSFDSDCLCNAAWFIRSNEKTVNWMRALLQWLWDNPFEHDQRAMAAFLNYTERISKPLETFPEVPPWHVLEPTNRWIHAFAPSSKFHGYWHGSITDIVAMHFMDGSSAHLHGRSMEDDISILYRKKSLMTAFYAADRDHTRHPGQDDHIVSVLEKWRQGDKPGPGERVACGMLPETESHSGRGWVGDLSL